MPDLTNQELLDLESRIGGRPWQGNITSVTKPPFIVQVNSVDLVDWCIAKGMDRNKALSLPRATLEKCYCTNKNYFDTVAGKRPRKLDDLQKQFAKNFGGEIERDKEDDIYDPPSQNHRASYDDFNDDFIDDIDDFISGRSAKRSSENEALKSSENERLWKHDRALIQSVDKKISDLGNSLRQTLSTWADNLQKKSLDLIDTNTAQATKNLEDKVKEITNTALLQVLQGIRRQEDEGKTEGKTEPKRELELSLPLPSSSPYVPKLDPHFYFSPYPSRVIREALATGENVYAYGDTGCGKTSHFEQICAVLNRGIIRINPHDGITREAFLGSMKLLNNETVFVPGALPKAMELGIPLLIDEISFLPPNLTAILNPVGEKGGKLYIPETSEWISPAPGFCLFATDNTGGKGDRTGQYAGTEVQNTATLDRFAYCLKMDYLPRDEEEKMLLHRYENLDLGELSKMLSLAEDVRNAFSKGELSITLSTRKLVMFFGQRARGFSVKEALENTLLSWLDEDDKLLVETYISRLEVGKDNNMPRNEENE